MHCLRGHYWVSSDYSWFNYFSARPRVCDAAFPHTIAHTFVVFKTLCCSECQFDLGWQHQDTGTRLVIVQHYSEIYNNCLDFQLQ